MSQQKTQRLFVAGQCNDPNAETQDPEPKTLNSTLSVPLPRPGAFGHAEALTGVCVPFAIELRGSVRVCMAVYFRGLNNW